MYYNNITRKMTEYPYRFKTHEEFVEEFGDGYNNYDNDVDFIGWFTNMDHLFGKDFTLDYETDFDHATECYILGDSDGSWYVDDTMLVKNENGLDYNKPTKLVYEKLVDNQCIIYVTESIIKNRELRNYLKDKVEGDIFTTFNSYDDVIVIINKNAYTYDESDYSFDEIVSFWESYGFVVKICTTIEEIKNVYEHTFNSKEVYNKPTRLVYEKLEGKYCIIYKCDDIKETKKLIDLLKINKDLSKLKKDLSEYTYIIIRSKVEDIDDNVDDKDYIYGIDSKWSMDRIVKFFEDKTTYDDEKLYTVYGCSNFEQVRKLLINNKDMYIKPTNLVYEKKILSFKKFNDK